MSSAPFGYKKSTPNGSECLMLFCETNYLFTFFQTFLNKVPKILGFACCPSTADKKTFLLVAM